MEKYKQERAALYTKSLQRGTNGRRVAGERNQKIKNAEIHFGSHQPIKAGGASNSLILFPSSLLRGIKVNMKMSADKQ